VRRGYYIPVSRGVKIPEKGNSLERMRLPARAAVAPASSLYLLQGTLQQIRIHRLLAERVLQLKGFLSMG